MPKIIAHALTGATIAVAAHPNVGIHNLTPVFLSMFLAVSPDLDMILEWLVDIPDIHRGFTHSLAFSFLVAVAIALWLQPGEARAAAVYSIAYLSHVLLDLSTSTSGGVKLFYPFSDRYYNLGLTGIFELPVGTSMTQIFAWVRIELLVFVPILLIAIAVRYFSGKFFT